MHSDDDRSLMAERKNPPQRTRRKHSIDFADDRWEKFGADCEQLGISRAERINQFVAWHNGEPGYKRPVRPTTSEPANRQ